MGDDLSALREVLQRHADEFAHLLAEAHARREPSSLFRRDEIEQFVRGLLPLYQEAFDGRREARDFYLATVIPGLVARGSTPERIVSEGWRGQLVLLGACTERLPAGTRAGAGLWMADFAAGWMEEVRQAAEQAAALREQTG